MKKTKESITLKRKKTYESAYAQAMRERKRKVDEAKERNKTDLERIIASIDKKILSKLKKKELLYDRKCKNEIRKLEGKQERVYKKRKKKFDEEEFTMDLLQEIAKLKDTDKNGNGRCISHSNNRLFSWGELAGGHRYSRTIKTTCCNPLNINAQCNGCNFTTGPRGNVVAKEQTNHIYDINLDRKYGKGTAERLKLLKDANFNKDIKINSYEKLDIMQLIELDERLWKLKTFYKPKKDWRKVLEEGNPNFKFLKILK